MFHYAVNSTLKNLKLFDIFFVRKIKPMRGLYKYVFPRST